jgi:hypothetical protein
VRGSDQRQKAIRKNQLRINADERGSKENDLTKYSSRSACIRVNPRLPVLYSSTDDQEAGAFIGFVLAPQINSQNIIGNSATSRINAYWLTIGAYRGRSREVKALAR